MAKPKRTPADLDAELAALEAELAALGQKKPKKEAPPPAPAKEAAPPVAPAPAEAPREGAPAKPARFGGLKLGRKAKAEAPAEAAPAAPKPEPAAKPAPAPARAAPQQSYDAALWRQEEGAWVRTVPGEARVVRRILDEKGEVVREEKASAQDLEERTPVKAERGIGKLFRRRSA